MKNPNFGKKFVKDNDQDADEDEGNPFAKNPGGGIKRKQAAETAVKKTKPEADE